MFISKKMTIHIILLFGLILSAVVITWAYVTHERTFYYWDYLIYQNTTIDQVVRYQTSPAEAIETLQQSMQQEYNRIFTILLMPFLFFADDVTSRLAFILGITIVYFVPFALVSGGIATRLVTVYRPGAFWVAAFLTVLMPSAWIPTLYGYPDIGAAFCISLVIFMYLQNMELKRWWQFPVMGFFLAVAPLFRRHFAYSSIAVLVSIALYFFICFLLERRQNPKVATITLISRGFRLGGVGVITLVVLAVIGWPFIQRALVNNYNLLYASYMNSPLENAVYYGGFFGGFTLILAGIGYFAGLFLKVVEKKALLYLGILGVYSVGQWLLLVRQLGLHYTLHFTLVVILGLVALVWVVLGSLKSITKIAVLSGIVIFIGINLAGGLTMVKLPAQLYTYRLMSFRFPPVIRTDYDVILSLVDYLRQLASKGQSIYVVSSSGVMNSDIIGSAERIKYGYRDKTLNLTSGWVTDSNGSYPLETLLQAQYIVLAHPFQYHLLSIEQEVVSLALDAFDQHWEITNDFQPLPVQFELSNNVILTVYERIRPSSVVTVLHTLTQLENTVKQRPGGQLDWLILGETPPLSIQKATDNTYQINPNYRFFVPSASFLYWGNISQKLELTGQIVYADKQCGGVTFRLTGLTSQGRETNSTEITHSPNDPQIFSLSLPKQGDETYLRFDITLVDVTALPERCRFKVESFEFK